MSGTVTDYESGKTITDAEITVIFSPFNQRTTKTDKNGKYSRRLYNESGKCQVFVDALNYTKAQIYGVNVEASKDNTLDIQLVKSGRGSLKGTIQNISDDSTIDNVKVSLKLGWSSPYEESSATLTDENGHYSFDDNDNYISTGHYTVELKKSSYKTETFNVIVSGNTTEQNWYMEEGSDEQIYDIPIDEARFPDAIFREYVKRFDTNSDGTLSEAEIENVTKIDVLGLGISSLEGVEYFKTLKRLNCAGNQLTTLDVNGCTALQWLNCDNNQLTVLDVSGCTILQELDCSDNQLTALDVSGCTALQELDCFNNQLIALDVSKNTALKSLGLYNNRLTFIDVSINTKLSYLNCEKNRITMLDLSNCPYLYSINLYHDDGVTIIWPSSATSSATALNSSRSASLKSDSASTILAVLPPFTPAESGTYTFIVSLDQPVHEDITLVLLEDSENLHGSFARTNAPDVVEVSADFIAGRTYAPVIAVNLEDGNHNGGCNIHAFGVIILLAGIMLVRMKRL